MASNALKNVEELRTPPVSGVSMVNTRTGAVTLNSADVSNALGYTPVSPANATFVVSPTAPTPVTADSSSKVATTAYVKASIGNSVAGVATFNSRSGAVALQGSDVEIALKSITPVLSYSQTTPWSGTATRNSITLLRDANYVGGGVDAFGNRNVGYALAINTTAGAGNTNCEYALSSVVTSYSNTDPNATTIGQSWPQNVGGFLGGFQYGSAPVWAANFSVQNKSGVAQAAGRGAVVGIELNVGITGTDTMNSSLGIDMVPQPMAGTQCSPWIGIRAAGDANVKWQYAFQAATGSVASFHSSATGDRGLHLAGSYIAAIDTSTATTATGTALRIKGGDHISLDAFDQFRLKHNPSTGFVEFWNNTTRKGYVDVTGGADGVFIQGAATTTLTGLNSLGGSNAVSLGVSALNMETVSTAGYIASMASATPTNNQIETIVRPLYAIISCLVKELKDRRVL